MEEEKLLPKPSLIDRFRIYARKNWKLMTLAGVALIAGSVMVYALFLQGSPSSPAAEAAKKAIPIYSPLTGMPVTAASAKRPVTAVMIENSPDARPQSSLNQAGIVFETMAEGGITRYLALYQEAKPKLIGPVRSLRPYYLDWAMGFDAAIAHAGGSADAMKLLKPRHAKSMNGLVFSDGYFRTADRPAPHNLYASTKTLDKLTKRLGYFKTGNFEPYARTDKGQPVAKPTHKTISMGFLGPLFGVKFRYQASSNSYLRFLNGAPDRDRESNKQIIVKNLVVIPQNITYGSQYAKVKTIGYGRVLVFRDGTLIKGLWRKKSPSSQLSFEDSNGKPIALNRGSTWIAFAPTSGTIKY